MPDNAVRDWLALVATSLSALFAGLIWLLARKRLSTRYAFGVDNNISPDVQSFKIEITNRSDAPVVIEAISVEPPLSILADETGGQYGSAANRDALTKAKHIRSAQVSRNVPPEQNHGWTIVLHRDGGFRSCKKISITLHILKSFPVIRHKKKVLTAILPASMRNAAE